MSSKHVIFRKDSFFDSIVLMQVSASLQASAEFSHVTVAMGTPINLQALRELGFESSLSAVGPNDLIVAVEAEDSSLFDGLEARINDLLRPQSETEAGQSFRPPDIDGALSLLPEANLALVSVPGRYAAYEGERALRRGLHLMLFSDNVSLEDESALKKYAAEQGLLCMGPDCGTAIINGRPLGFANQVRRGPVGIVAASGTGIQEVSSLLDRAGLGVSQASGTGGRDLSPAIGGSCMLQAVAALQADASTEVIVALSKPAAPEITEKLHQALAGSTTPAIMHILGSGDGHQGRVSDSDGVWRANTLEEAAAMAGARLAGEVFEPRDFTMSREELAQMVAGARKKLSSRRRYVRGFFSGGTLCQEALFLLQRSDIGEIRSNIHPLPDKRLADPHVSLGHSLIDLGDDLFTAGRPHPMIDPSTRLYRMRHELDDDEAAIWLLDCVIGYAAHDDPAGAMVPVIREAAPKIVVIASVTGTAADPQDLAAQQKKLRDAGALVLPSNAQAARLAGRILDGR